jgi:hypothetical protein
MLIDREVIPIGFGKIPVFLTQRCRLEESIKTIITQGILLRKNSVNIFSMGYDY